MKKITAILCALLLLCSSTMALADLSDYNVVTSAQTHKVILDTDMGYFGDDTYALFILLQADAAGWIDLLGVTASAPKMIATGTTAILNLLEEANRGDVPVYMGVDIPLMGLYDDATLAGAGLTRLRVGNQILQYGRSITYDNLGDQLNATWGYSSLEPQKDMTAAEFMVEQANLYPGQVTIMVIGSPTNVALAIKQDPDFASKTAGIYYMGGAIDVPGNVTPCAEMNWYYDPEAVDICLRADFPLQVIVPDDISYNQRLTRDKVEAMVNAGETPYTNMVEEHVLPKFIEDPNRSSKLWDAQVPGIFLVPDLITVTDQREVAIITDLCPAYGESVAWEVGEGPSFAKECTIVYDVDGDAYWAFVAELYGTDFSK